MLVTLRGERVNVETLFSSSVVKYFLSLPFFNLDVIYLMIG